MMCHGYCCVGSFQLSGTVVSRGNADSEIFPAATSEEAKTGTYYVPTATENAGSKYSQDPKLAGELWEWTEQQLAEHGY